MDKQSVKESLGNFVNAKTIPMLAAITPATRTRFFQQGLLPGIKLGGSWYCDPDRVAEALAETTARHQRGPRVKAPKVNEAHERAVASLKAKGLL